MKWKLITNIINYLNCKNYKAEMHWVKCQTVTTYTIAFALPWINDALSHLMYQESGYL